MPVDNSIILPSTSSDNVIKYSVFDDKECLPHILPSLQDLEIIDTGVSHWNIKDWKHLDNRCHGPIFKVGQYSWRVLLYPKGNGIKDMVSIYLEALPENNNNDNETPDDWYVCAQFGLVISNPEDPTNYYASHSHHRFSAEEIDWGFTRFYDLKELTKLYRQKGPFLVNNQTVISVYLRVIKDETGVLWHNLINYDSRKETGFVGIKNQGATCYMNSLLQSLYCTNLFRKAVYQIPTQYEDPTKSVALALQRLFYQLQYATEPVGTTELTKSFGWDSLDAFMQHDVQEFSRVLLDNLELKMEDASEGGSSIIKQLFVGKMKSYIKCIDVDYESSRVEDFYDIQLNVMGCGDVQESFREYIREETMDGENKYMAEGYGLQNALKGVTFESFPPVLHLQLKRFEYDGINDMMVKINDRYVYPEELCLDDFCTDRQQSYTYVLHSVFVHSGDFDGGHYFTLIKPGRNEKWLRFDDDHVTPVTEKEVFEDNFGDEPSRKILQPLVNTTNDSNLSPTTTTTTTTTTMFSTESTPPHDHRRLRGNSLRSIKRFTNAYMLVYIQKDKWDQVLAPVLEEDIPVHLQRWLRWSKRMVKKMFSHVDRSYSLTLYSFINNNKKKNKGIHIQLFFIPFYYKYSFLFFRVR
ncbi:uncharacterized protein BX664DRAFT_86528 [Halteromyces radiatus]|uniref:uncharacterized protein n=1 Tax=Halteromyces radiatus TaxID=101107 RepID=UPI00221F0EE6|nr:uncharacterized protein BX664DRAFT_86528 [Halteromyces radiatus]KAI8097769.1 hypothetical protein BX664DRAFT_86528 [Halteromyces radiatus]